MLPSGEIAAGHGKLSIGRRLSGAARMNLVTRLGGAGGLRRAANATAAIATAASPSVIGSRSRFCHVGFVRAAVRSGLTISVVPVDHLPCNASANSRAVVNLSAG